MRKYGVQFNMVAILFIATMLFNPNSSHGANTEVKRIAVFPFEVMAKEDAGFIGKGMGKMLCSRIAADDKIEVRCLDRLPSEYGLDLSGSEILKKIAGITELHGVDFILTGTVTIAGDSVSSDAKLVEVIQPEQPKYITVSGTGMGDIMNHALAISEKARAAINGQSSGYIGTNSNNVVDSSGKNTLAGGQVVINTNNNQTAQDGSALPIDSMKGVSQSSKSESIQSGISSASKGMIMSHSDSPVLMSRKLNMEIIGMATADIDGDGKIDFTVIDDHTVSFFVFSNNTLVKKGEYKSEYYNRNIAIDAVDSNNNGRSELFVTAVGKNNYLKSYVLEWNGREFEPIAKDADWYFRVVNYDGKAKLIGQKRGHDEPFSDSIYALSVSGNSIAKLDKIDAANSEIFGFSPAKVQIDGNMGSNGRYFIWLDRSGFLNLGDDRGTREWKSTRSFGSTAQFIEQDMGKNQLKTRTYINHRVIVADINHDGIEEIITVNNEDVAKGYLSGYRKFTSGNINVMAWKSGSMVDLLHTNSSTGYISDFNVIDMDGDGYPEIIYSVVAETGLVMNKTHSTVFIQKIVSQSK
ncbi:MAG: VCBS repeat-containing protein [Desulfamplus sp.]|nr:VCBS repeat-containing protein [Desulfamplus sp.]